MAFVIYLHIFAVTSNRSLWVDTPERGAFSNTKKSGSVEHANYLCDKSVEDLGNPTRAVSRQGGKIYGLLPNKTCSITKLDRIFIKDFDLPFCFEGGGECDDSRRPMDSLTSGP